MKRNFRPGTSQATLSIPNEGAFNRQSCIYPTGYGM